MRTTAILSTIVLSAGLVAGCGGSSGGSGSAYCDDLKDAKSQFSSLGSGDFDKFSEALKAFHKLADEAPASIEDEWKSLDGALSDFEDALKDAGLTFEDFGKISSGGLPEGMSQEDVQAALPKIQAAVQTLSGGSLEKASSAIEKHAKSTCKVDLTDS